MDKIIEEFIYDVCIKRPQDDDLEEKYQGILPQVTLKEVVSHILTTDLVEKLVKTKFYGDKRDRQGPTVLKVGNKYEFFFSERGGKLSLKTFDSVGPALSIVFDLVLYSFGMDAVDSNRHKNSK